MKTKDKIIAFAVLIAAVINTYECAKKIKRDIDNWAETTTITKNINVENTKDNNQINIPTRRIDCELFTVQYVDGKYVVEYVEKGVGPANIDVIHTKNGDYILSANHTMNEAAIYKVME